MAAGLATPLPAMSCALPCATEENRIGLPIVSAAAAFLRQELRGDVALVVQHDDEGVDALHVKHGVGAERARWRAIPLATAASIAGLMIRFPRAEQAAFAGMRIEAADGDLRRGDAHAA